MALKQFKRYTRTVPALLKGQSKEIRHKVVEYLVKNERGTMGELSVAVGVSQSQLLNALHPLRWLGIIKRVPAYYVLDVNIKGIEEVDGVIKQKKS